MRRNDSLRNLHLRMKERMRQHQQQQQPPQQR
jgi:hypothetical protein